VYGFGFTAMPARTFCTPSATTRSPGFNPIFEIARAIDNAREPRRQGADQRSNR